ncbi:hypothetical protein K7X08_012852 [Anisodus acutangulus]|uniref:Uncharacterized protein n=1 Tax=Anisodus acutangulus TaxID=402998 RepID=A0A9Q1M9W2_9SOLA|nr:hypothetical protein K7X08_012852 [Anisodus acutangulus]
MSNSADDNTNEKMEQMCNEGTKDKVGKAEKGIDNVITKEWIEQSFFGNKNRVESVERTEDLKEMAEIAEQVDSAQSSENVIDIFPSTEEVQVKFFEEDINNEMEVDVLSNNKEVHKTGVPEKLESQVEISEKDLLDVHNKDMELVEESINGDILSNIEGLNNSLVPANAHAIVQVPQDQ